MDLIYNAFLELKPPKNTGSVKGEEDFNNFVLTVFIMGEVTPGFHRIEFNKTVWEVPLRYQNLTPVGSGAYGQVW